MATILIVEDHLVTQRVLSKRLRNSGHEVLTAQSGLQALEQLAEHTVDLVLCDIAMPEMDGLTFLRQVRSEERHRDMPIVMLTASVLDQHKQEARAAGANGFLEKPVSSWELDQTVERLLQG